MNARLNAEDSDFRVLSIRVPLLLPSVAIRPCSKMLSDSAEMCEVVHTTEKDFS
jgi:hypothetical protein